MKLNRDLEVATDEVVRKLLFEIAPAWSNFSKHSEEEILRYVIENFKRVALEYSRIAELFPENVR